MKQKKVAIIANSNPLSNKLETEVDALVNKLQVENKLVQVSPYLYEKDSPYDPKDLMNLTNALFMDPQTEMILDLSGGDLGNQVIAGLNYGVIADSKAVYYGYSDLTTVLNAILSQTGKPSVLYHARYVGPISDLKDPQFYQFSFQFLQGQSLKGQVIGGNIRCLLKLAGTKYWPDFKDKILFLESLSGDVKRMQTFLNQLQQIGVFDQIKGLILGSFTEMENDDLRPTMEEMVQSMVRADLPLIKTDQIGHQKDAKPIIIGAHYEFHQDNFSIENYPW